MGVRCLFILDKLGLVLGQDSLLYDNTRWGHLMSHSGMTEPYKEWDTLQVAFSSREPEPGVPIFMTPLSFSK
jgi:hypothetical protein